MSRPQGSFNFSNEDIALILDLHDKGRSLKEISEEVHCNKSTVFRFIRRFS